MNIVNNGIAILLCFFAVVLSIISHENGIAILSFVAAAIWIFGCWFAFMQAPGGR